MLGMAVAWLKLIEQNLKNSEAPPTTSPPVPTIKAVTPNARSRDAD
jgi:hypothetical protein